MKRLILFASGSGSNVENIITYFSDGQQVDIVSVITDNKEAKVIQRCKRLKVPLIYLSNSALKDPRLLVAIIASMKPSLIVLAGYLKMIPKEMVQHFNGKMINLHPSLLPKYGGKGMFGMNVHNAVVAAGEKETGITIHYVNERYDEGNIIFQAKVQLDQDDSPEDVAQKIHRLEHTHFPRVIEKLLRDNGN